MTNVALSANRAASEGASANNAHAKTNQEYKPQAQYDWNLPTVTLYHYRCGFATENVKKEGNRMGKGIKIRLLQLEKKQVDLLEELRKRGYPKLYASQLSRYISGADVSPQAEAVMETTKEILSEWESA